MNTEDYYLASYLIAKGFDLQSIAPKGSKWIFCFGDEVAEEVEKYFFNQATVNPQAYESARRNLKSLIQANKNKNENNTKRHTCRNYKG